MVRENVGVLREIIGRFASISQYVMHNTNSPEIDCLIKRIMIPVVFHIHEKTTLWYQLRSKVNLFANTRMGSSDRTSSTSKLTQQSSSEFEFYLLLDRGSLHVLVPIASNASPETPDNK